MMDQNYIKIIEENPMALATITPDNKPNVIAVAYAKVVDNNHILITDNYMSQTIEDIKVNNNICLAVWDKNWDGFKIIGEAEYYSDGKWLSYVKKMSENKDLPAKGAIVVKVNRLEKLK